MILANFHYFHWFFTVFLLFCPRSSFWHIILAYLKITQFGKKAALLRECFFLWTFEFLGIRLISLRALVFTFLFASFRASFAKRFVTGWLSDKVEWISFYFFTFNNFWKVSSFASTFRCEVNGIEKNEAILLQFVVISVAIHSLFSSTCNNLVILIFFISLFQKLPSVFANFVQFHFLLS